VKSAYPAIVLTLALGLLSCDSRPDAAADTRKPETHTVTMEAVAFKPDDLTVRTGDTIVWVNKDAFPHTATSKAGFDSKDIAPEKSFTFTATQTGEFPYTCTYHPTMKGVVRVK
jgi:plastocyanin